jgi:hypothetical protein
LGDEAVAELQAVFSDLRELAYGCPEDCEWLGSDEATAYEAPCPRHGGGDENVRELCSRLGYAIDVVAAVLHWERRTRNLANPWPVLVHGDCLAVDDGDTVTDYVVDVAPSGAALRCGERLDVATRVVRVHLGYRVVVDGRHYKVTATPDGADLQREA